MRAKPIPSDVQYQRILECRSSGMSDYQWCLEHDIKPGTFYNWVKRLRQKGTVEVPQATSPSNHSPLQPDVVQVSLHKPAVAEIVGMPSHAVSPSLNSGLSNSSDPAIELILPGATIRIHNGANPQLLEHTLQILGGHHAG